MSTPIWPLYGQANVQAANARAAEDNQSLGKDEFLKILITQMQNQDPTQPLQDREFITQMAQFSSVEQLMKMSVEMKALRQSIGISSDLIGKFVSWNDVVGDQLVLLSGKVESITFQEGMQFVEVGDAFIPIDALVRIEQHHDQPNEQPDEQEEVSEP